MDSGNDGGTLGTTAGSDCSVAAGMICWLKTSAAH